MVAISRTHMQQVNQDGDAKDALERNHVGTSKAINATTVADNHHAYSSSTPQSVAMADEPVPRTLSVQSGTMAEQPLARTVSMQSGTMAEQPLTRTVSVQSQGLPLIDTPASNRSWA